MEERLINALKKAMGRLGDFVSTVKWGDDAIPRFQNANESTFRAFVLEALMEAAPEARCQLEWNTKKYDMLVLIGDESAIVEFKFFVYRRTTQFKDGGWVPGGRRDYVSTDTGGTKRDGGIPKDIEKLGASLPEINQRYLVVVYEKGKPEGTSPRKLTFDQFCNKHNGSIWESEVPREAITRIPHEVTELECLLVEVEEQPPCDLGAPGKSL